MHDSIVSRETWTYECLSCQHEWQEEFEVGRSSDGHGGEVVVYRRRGQRCTTPWSELFCPSCGGYDVKILPTGWAAVPRPRQADQEMIFHLRQLHESWSAWAPGRIRPRPRPRRRHGDQGARRRNRPTHD